MWCHELISGTVSDAFCWHSLLEKCQKWFKDFAGPPRNQNGRRSKLYRPNVRSRWESFQKSKLNYLSGAAVHVFISIYIFELQILNGFSLGWYSCPFVPWKIDAIVLVAFLGRLLFTINVPGPAILFAMNDCLFFAIELNFHVGQWITTEIPSKFIISSNSQIVSKTLTSNSIPSMDSPIAHDYRIPFPNCSDCSFHFAWHFSLEYKCELVCYQYVRGELRWSPKYFSENNEFTTEISVCRRYRAV